MGEPDTSTIYSNLPDNSHANRKEKQEESTKTSDSTREKRVEKIVHGKVTKKENKVRKLTDIFIAEDVTNVKDYIIMDVIVPSVKKALYDLTVGAIDMILYGGRGDGEKRSTADKISYRDYNSMSRRGDRYRDRTRTNSGYSYDDIVLDTRGEAETVLSRMDEIMEEYGIVRVADLYDLVGESGDYTDNNYGWTNIRNAKIVRTHDGYKIDMPRALPIR